MWVSSSRWISAFRIGDELWFLSATVIVSSPATRAVVVPGAKPDRIVN
jgi:hypothetical protein